MKKNKVLLFGGTFDPPHYGHLFLAQYMKEELDFDTVIFVPSARPNLKSNYTPFDVRYHMMEMALVDNQQSYFKVSNIENKIDGPSYTIKTVRYLEFLGQEENEISWLIGPDILKDLINWHKIDELVEECNFVLAVDKGCESIFHTEKLFNKDLTKEQLDLWELKHQPCDNRWFKVLPPFKDYPFYAKINETLKVVGFPKIEIRSTMIRERVRKGLGIEYLVPYNVKIIIENYELYKTEPQHSIIQ